jgi:hypothetical protein
MSILKKNALAVALVAGMGLAGSAGAYNLFTSGDVAPVMVATADIADNTTPIGINETFDIVLTGGDFILGRTTGFTVRYNLSTGAFADAVTTADIVNAGPNSSWLISVIAGGNVGDNFIVIKLDPAAVPVGLVPGNLLSINAALAVVAPPPGTGQILNGLAALQTSGNQVVANLLFVDPVTSAQILPSGSLPILKSGNPVVQDCDSTAGDTAKTIDVGTDGVHAPKTYFSATGTIGADDAGYINLGSITASVDPAFPSFAYQATDTFTTVVTGDFSAFSAAGNSVFLASDAGCTTQVGANGVINNANGTVTFTYDNATVGGGAGGYTAYVCAAVAGGNATVIDASSVSVQTTFTRGATTSASTSCDLLDLRYNGSVVDVYVINPAGNTTAQSFIRVINPSNGAGTVSIVGTDDAGNVSTPVSFSLAAGASMQINSEDLENGNAAKGLTGSWGNGAGKWRAVVTGEFAGMRVQSLNRNYNDGTVTNLTDADGKGEQTFQKLFDN